MLSFTTFVLLIGGVASSVTSQAGASRLLYGMGRDGILPQRIFGYLDPKRATPTRSIIPMGFIAFAGALLVTFQTVVELVSFGAFVGFILVNLSVIRHFCMRQRERAGMVPIMRNLVFRRAGLPSAYIFG